LGDPKLEGSRSFKDGMDRMIQAVNLKEEERRRKKKEEERKKKTEKRRKKKKE
jgi:hypothetical protein